MLSTVLDRIAKTLNEKKVVREVAAGIILSYSAGKHQVFGKML